MKNQIKILDKVFSTLLSFEKKEYLSLDAKNITFGFCPAFEGGKDNFMTFFPFDHSGGIGVSIDEKKERSKFQEISDLLKNNFSPGFGYEKLPVYFEVDDFEGKWSVRKCGEYYLCSKIASYVWGSFCITNSEQFAILWIEQKRSQYTNNIETLSNQIEEAENKVKSLKAEHSKWRENLLKFNYIKEIEIVCPKAQKPVKGKIVGSGIMTKTDWQPVDTGLSGSETTNWKSVVVACSYCHENHEYALTMNPGCS